MTNAFFDRPILNGPGFDILSRPDLVSAAGEAGDADFDVLIACAFNYDAHSFEFDKLGCIPVLKARMNANLHKADDLKNTGKGNPSSSSASLASLFSKPKAACESRSTAWMCSTPIPAKSAATV